MSFRRRNVGLAGTAQSATEPKKASLDSVRTSGIRPSPVDGRPTTSTGSQSLDGLFAGHAGLPLGSSVLLEEKGTTDYAGVILRYFVAEGIAQGHKLHIIGVPEQWLRKLPGISTGGSKASSKPKSSHDSDKMKIAWRYERLGEFGASQREQILPNRTRPGLQSAEDEDVSHGVFCHEFDLSKSFDIRPAQTVHFIPVNAQPNAQTLSDVLAVLAKGLGDGPPDTVHRIALPSFLSPAAYPSNVLHPTVALPFMQGLRSLAHKHARNTCCLLSMSSTLFPPTSGLTKWFEHLADGVLVLEPFLRESVLEPASDVSDGRMASSGAEVKPQGLLYVRKLPLVTDRGQGSGAHQDMAFSLSRKHLTIMPYYLPPTDSEEPQPDKDSTKTASAKQLEF